MLDSLIPLPEGTQVEVQIRLQAPAQQQLEPDDEEERLWLTAHAANPAFDDLRDPREDIYSLSDGQPLNP